MGARAPFNAANLLLFLMPPGGIRTGPRASSMRPASHANLHLINTRGVFAARAACVPICAFCFYAPRPHRLSSSFSRMPRSFSTAAMRRRQAASAAACRRSSRAWACSTRAIPEKTGADSPGSKCSPAQSLQGHHAMKEGAKKVPAHPAPQLKPGHERPCRALTAAWARFPAPRAGCLTVAAARAYGRPGTSWRAAGLLAWRRPCWG